MMGAPRENWRRPCWTGPCRKSHSLDTHALKTHQASGNSQRLKTWMNSVKDIRIICPTRFLEWFMPEQRQGDERNLLKIITIIFLFSRLNFSGWVFEQERYCVCLMPACPSVHHLTRIFLSYHQFKILDVAKQKRKALSLGWALLLPLSAAASLLWLWSIVPFTFLPLTWKTGMNILRWHSTALQWWTTTFRAHSVMQKVLLYGRRQVPACSGPVLVMYHRWLCTASRQFYMQSNPKARGVM